LSSHAPAISSVFRSLFSTNQALVFLVSPRLRLLHALLLQLVTRLLVVLQVFLLRLLHLLCLLPPLPIRHLLMMIRKMIVKRMLTEQTMVVPRMTVKKTLTELTIVILMVVKMIAEMLTVPPLLFLHLPLVFLFLHRQPSPPPFLRALYPMEHNHRRPLLPPLPPCIVVKL
jgi:hypothetical protein